MLLLDKGDRVLQEYLQNIYSVFMEILTGYICGNYWVIMGYFEVILTTYLRGNYRVCTGVHTYSTYIHTTEILAGNLWGYLQGTC